jgi:amino acid adenylation domain-containing protein
MGRRLRACCALELHGELDATAVEAALADVLGLHEIARTTYVALPGTRTAIQVIASPGIVRLEQRDWSGEGRDGAERALAALLAEPLPWSESAAALAQEPLFLPVLARVAPRRHVLVLRLSPLGADLGSLELLSQAVCRAYAARTQGPAPGEDCLQYADVAEVFCDLLESADTEAGPRYWRELDLTPFLTASIPGDSAVTGETSGVLGQRSWEITPELAAAIDATAVGAGTSLPVFVLACWQLLVARLSESTEWSVAVALGGRTYQGLERALGAFARYLPLRCTIDLHARFDDFLRQVVQALAEAEAWQDYFDLEQCLRVAGRQSEPELPYARLAFSAAKWPDETAAGGLTARFLAAEAVTERSDLELVYLRRGAAGQLCLRYDPACYTAADISRLEEQLCTLMRACADRPGAAVAELPIIGPSELALLASFDRTDRDWPLNRCVHESFTDQVRRTPGRLAVAFAGQQLTYAELDARANQLAHHLSSLGVGPESRVGLCLDRSVDQIVAILGILKAGAAYVPLDPIAPRARLEFMLDEAEVTVVVTHGELRVLFGSVPRLVCMDRDAKVIAAAPATMPSMTVHPHDLAYVLFTSGSTGKPKGAMIEHRSVVNLARALDQAIYRGRTGLKVSMNAPLVFDASVKQWAQLLNGHSLHIVPEEARPDPVQLLGFMRAHAMDVLDCTPLQLRAMLDHGLGRAGELSPALVLVGGEAIDPPLWALMAASPQSDFYNMYGPTECTVNATVCSTRAVPQPSIGWPLGNVRVQILDDHRQLVPIGVTGEICIAGAGVARGYVRRPELTAERFFAEPSTGVRLYRTGDLGRRLSDGRIEFLGRRDHQVKIRGYRVELGEIESALVGHPAVLQAVAVVRDLVPGEPHIVAYVVPAVADGPGADGGPALAAELRAALRLQVPEYMVPWVIVPITSMPLTRNGKIDRAALPDPHGVLAGPAPHVEPASTVEKTIAAIWKDVLGVDRVGRHNNFFDLGGHSVLLVRLHERLVQSFGKQLALVELFRHPTVATQAHYLGDQSETSGGDALADIEDRARTQRLARQRQAGRVKAERDK